MVIELIPEQDIQKVLINGEDVTPHIRSLQVSGQAVAVFEDRGC